MKKNADPKNVYRFVKTTTAENGEKFHANFDYELTAEQARPHLASGAAFDPAKRREERLAAAKAKAAEATGTTSAPTTPATTSPAKPN